MTTLGAIRFALNKNTYAVKVRCNLVHSTAPETTSWLLNLLSLLAELLFQAFQNFCKALVFLALD